MENALVIFDRISNGASVLNTKMPVDGVWQNGYDNCCVVHLHYPVDLNIEKVLETFKISRRGILWFI